MIQKILYPKVSRLTLQQQVINPIGLAPKSAQFICGFKIVQFLYPNSDLKKFFLVVLSFIHASDALNYALHFIDNIQQCGRKIVCHVPLTAF